MCVFGRGSVITSSYGFRISRASVCFVTPSCSIFFMPWMYFANSLRSAASMGALSTEMMSLIRAGFRRANAIAVLAPLWNE